ncbi:putative LRR receptor-like serine/threonine-protein kinase [Canna indica]|uniref:LRR receptor-like serine/threonine-protein kinase n=1 Tax=Canna indica TaxID=4628 RepID=A0AAQ3KCJ3_9LILI|nr:putative LRR receptor-like serine/threonine-protein kinase [Canna indica]
MQMLKLALICTNPSPIQRPTMSNVLSILEGKTSMELLFVAHASSKSMDFRFQVTEDFCSERQSSMEILIVEEISKEGSSLLSSASFSHVSKGKHQKKEVKDK